MHGLKGLFALAIVSLGLMINSSSGNSAPELEKICPRQRDETSYQHRDGNRCEGVRGSRIARSHAELVSVTLKPTTNTNQNLPDVLSLKLRPKTDIYTSRFPSPRHKINSTNVRIREFSQYYWLDNFSIQSRGDYLTFQWSTKILKRLKIQPSQLHGSATDKYGIFAPVIIAPPSFTGKFHYEFGIFDEEKELKLIDFQIYDEAGNRIELVKFIPSSSSHQTEFISVQWDGLQNNKPLNPGVYSLRFKVEIRDEEGVTTPSSQTYKFLYEPNYLSP